MLKRFSKGMVLGVTLLGAGLMAPVHAQVSQINGAGSTFAYPLYSQWAAVYYKKYGVALNYQSIGSGGGIQQIYAHTVDFGASDAPLTLATLHKHDLVQFPTAMGGVVPVVNIPGIKAGQMHLTGKVLANIYLGEIMRWNDPQITRLNPGLSLPNEAITVVHRSDGSGTTFIFTNYLTKISKAWAKNVGNAKAVSWPTGIGGKGNEGVAAYAKRIPGAIGYVEFAYATQNHMSYVLMKNRAGDYVKPSIQTFQAAAAGADWQHAPGYYLILTNQPGAKSWPITGATFVLVYKHPSNPQRTLAVLKFFDWGIKDGRRIAEKLDYVPMPMKVVRMIVHTWEQKIKGSDGQPLWKPFMGY